MIDEPRFLSAAQAAKTYEYLRSLAERYPTTAVRVQCLFGRCCLAANSDFKFDLHQVAGEASCIADEILADPRSQQLGLDPLLIVETNLLLKAAGSDVPALDTLAKKISAELAAQSDDIRSMGRVRLVASKLLSLDCDVQVAKPGSRISALMESVDQWLTLPAKELSDVADHLFADRIPLTETGSRMLSLVALGELRNYKIDLSCKLLRLVALQGQFSEEADEAFRYVAVQRRRDGGYGFVNPFLEESQDSVNVDLSLHLPMTLNAVWLFGIEAVRHADNHAAVAVA